MKTLIAFFLLAFCVAAEAQTWQNCSSPHMVKTGSKFSCPAAYPPEPYKGYPATNSDTYTDTCTNDESNTIYFTAVSTEVGNGACMQDMNHLWHNCPSVNIAKTTVATSAADYNRMYNYEYDQDVFTSGIPPTTIYCKQIGAWRQDMQQCFPQKCTRQCVGAGCHCCTCTKTGGTTIASGCASPIIVDTKGTGFHLSSAKDGVIFDIRGDGNPERVAWPVPESGNAFLVLDRDRNGSIDSGKELFGNYTVQQSCPEQLKNGFRALDELDLPENGGNGDRIIDKRDTMFSLLRLWIDKNHNGVSEPGELHKLPELGVYSIDLHYFEPKPMPVDQWGNSCKYAAKVNPEGEPNGDSVNRMTCDFWFVTEKDEKAGHVALGSGDIIFAANQ